MSFYKECFNVEFRSILFFVFTVYMLAADMANMFKGIEAHVAGGDERRTIAYNVEVCISQAFLLILCGAVIVHIAMKNYITLIIVQVLSVVCGILRFLYDLILVSVTMQYGWNLEQAPTLLFTTNTDTLLGMFGVGAYLRFYAVAFYLFSFILQFEKDGEPHYILELIQVLKKKSGGAEAELSEKKL